MLGSMRWAYLIGLSVCLGGLGTPPFGLAGQSDPVDQAYRKFCAPGIVRDYEQPFSRLPKVHSIPESGHLPFGPRSLELAGVVPLVDHVLVGGGEFGFRFSEQSYVRRSLSLNWTVTVQMQALDGQGRVKREIDRRRIWIGKVRNDHPLSIALDVPAGIGFYRFDIQFANRAGRLLGRFSDYVRVVRPWLGARVEINGHSFHRGDLVFTRVDNIGTRTVALADDLAVERFDGSRWIHVTLPPGEWSSTLTLALVGAGGRGVCSVFEIPGEFPMGHYRVVREIAVKGWPGDGHSIFRMAEFDVLA